TNVGSSTIIEGFTITGGHSGGPTSPGGGLILFGSNAIVRNNIITGNSSSEGGGIAIHGGSPTISGNTISRNEVSVRGGGICDRGSTALIVQDIIVDNTSSGLNFAGIDQGGGMWCGGSSQIRECTIVGNHAAQGAGLFVPDLASPTVSR